jgi:uncharacterized protein VirK/YbjX
LNFFKTLSVTASIIRNHKLLLPLLLSRPDSELGKLLRARPEILEMVHGPYLAANWDAKTKIARLVDHCGTVAAIGGAIHFPANAFVELIPLACIKGDYRITLDQARWLLREGQLTFSLWDGIDRIFHLCFSLSTKDGKRIAYIGAIQGRAQGPGEPDIMDRYQVFTKAAFGLRPRDFLVEAFKMLCRALNVDVILAVADHNHPQRQLIRDVKLSYDEIWRDRGGHDNGDGFFILPVSSSRRDVDAIPAKKRAMYRKRYSMLEEIERDLVARMKSAAADNDSKPLDKT